MQTILSFFKAVINLLLPLRCIQCGMILKNYEGVCSSCWPLIPFISKPYCACCGLPFDYEIEEGALCGACSQESPSYTTARSVFIYTQESKSIILKLKHTDRTYTASLLGEWMTRVLEFQEECLCVPVPLHWTRLFMRTYNQAALLAAHIAKQKGWTYAPTLLLRHRRTPSQGRLSKKGRVRNVEGAFCVKSAKRSQLLGKKVLLVDDVFTTGSTLEACSKTLLKAGAKEVHVVTLGRVVKTY